MQRDDQRTEPDPLSVERGRRRLLSALLLELFALLLVWGLLRFEGDASWPTALILFAPRWIYGLPLLPLSLFVLRHDPRLLPLVAVSILVLGLGVMDFHLRPRALLAPSPSPRPKDVLRVMTYNMGGGRMNSDALQRLITATDPDLVAGQECFDFIGGGKRHMGTRHLRFDHGVCLISKYPIRSTEVRDRRDVEAMHGSGAIVRYAIEAPDGVINLVNVHLATVRRGLRALLRRGPFGAAVMRENIALRDYESRVARAWVDATALPRIVAGDFNLPEESVIYRRYWSNLTNAFGAAGFGFGSTKATRWHTIRIDHVLLGPGWSCDRAFVGPSLGGDHRPLIVDLRRPDH